MILPIAPGRKMWYNKDTKGKGNKKMKKWNLWKSEYTGWVYPQPTDLLPKYGGWTIIGTIESDKMPDPYKVEEKEG